MRFENLGKTRNVVGASAEGATELLNLMTLKLKSLLNNVQFLKKALFVGVRQAT